MTVSFLIGASLLLTSLTSFAQHTGDGPGNNALPVTEHEKMIDNIQEAISGSELDCYKLYDGKINRTPLAHKVVRSMLSNIILNYSTEKSFWGKITAYYDSDQNKIAIIRNEGDLWKDNIGGIFWLSDDQKSIKKIKTYVGDIRTRIVNEGTILEPEIQYVEELEIHDINAYTCDLN